MRAVRGVRAVARRVTGAPGASHSTHHGVCSGPVVAQCIALGRDDKGVGQGEHELLVLFREAGVHGEDHVLFMTWRGFLGLRIPRDSGRGKAGAKRNGYA